MTMYKRNYAILAQVLLGSILSFSVVAEDEVLIRKGDSVITHEEFDARIEQIPVRDRLAFVRDGTQVDRLLRNLILIRQIADNARENEYDSERSIQIQMQIAAEQRLANSWIDRQVANADVPDYDQLAQEYYTVNAEQYQSEFTVDVSHILVKTEERPEAQARELAEGLLSRLDEDPSQFEQLVREYSEDPSASSNHGLFRNVKRGTMVPAFEQVAFAMTQPGEISQLVQTPYGFHIIRLEQTNPSKPISFDEAKSQLIQQQKANHLSRVRSEFVNQFSTVELEIPPQAIEKMLQRYFGENLENAPDYSGIRPQEQ
jgi:peptidyl-prolyl cis-trans isomerase C